MATAAAGVTVVDLGVTKENKERQVDNNVRATIIRQGEVIVVPPAITLGTAVSILQKQMELEEQTIRIHRQFEGIPWADAALALQKAMEKTFLWVDAMTQSGIFEANMPPQKIKIKSGPNGETVSVAIGKFGLAVADGATCAIGCDGITCSFYADVKRKFEDAMNRMLDLAERLMIEESIYRGKALTFRRVVEESMFGSREFDDLGFMRLAEDMPLILNDEVERDLNANIWTLMRDRERCVMLGIPPKRSVLMFGNYGTGKTLAAYATARVAEETGHTFVYAKDARHLTEAYRFARTMSPSVLFVEDVDQLVGEEDDEGRDYVSVLSTVLDGINTKDSDVILILTTNHVEKIPAILLRPGRIDASIEVAPPDANTVRRLIRHYAPTTEGDTTAAAEMLQGQIPAIIREACERGKLFALAAGRENLDGLDILDAARSMTRQMELLKKATEKRREPTIGEDLHRSFYKAFREEPNGEYAQS